MAFRPNKVQDGSPSISKVADPRNFLTPVLMGLQSMCGGVTSHHASVTYTIYLANQNDSEERHLQTPRYSQSELGKSKCNNVSPKINSILVILWP